MALPDRRLRQGARLRFAHRAPRRRLGHEGAFLEKTIALKRPRRIQVGDRLCFIFEDRHTLTFQIQEMIRTERIVKEDTIVREVAVDSRQEPGNPFSWTAGSLEIEVEEIMGFVKTQEELDRYYGLGVREFIDAKMLGVMFATRMPIIERVLPPPLEPPDAAGGLIFIAEYPETNLGPGYREAALFIRCKYQGEAGSYCLSMPIDSEESRIYNGRDIFGFPKKKADIHLERDDRKARGWVERHGKRFVEVSVELSGTLPEMPPQGPNFLFKGSPRIDLQPGFDGPVMLCRHQTTVEMKSMEIGAAEVVLRESEDDPWAEIEITEVNVGFYLVSDNTMQPGRVLGEIDGDAYLPYYFKMTDFFSG